MTRALPERSEQQPPAGGAGPQRSLTNALSGASQDAFWFTACAWCQRVRVRGRWIEMPVALELIGTQPGHDPLLTHGICPSCFRQVSSRATDERRRRDA